MLKSIVASGIIILAWSSGAQAVSINASVDQTAANAFSYGFSVTAPQDPEPIPITGIEIKFPAINRLIFPIIDSRAIPDAASLRAPAGWTAEIADTALWAYDPGVNPAFGEGAERFGTPVAVVKYTEDIDGAIARARAAQEEFEAAENTLFEEEDWFLFQADAAISRIKTVSLPLAEFELGRLDPDFGERARLQSDIDRLQAELDPLVAERNRLQTRRDDLEAQRNGAPVEVQARLIAEITEIDEQLAAIQPDLRNISDQLASKESALLLLPPLDNLDAALEAARGRVTELKARIEDLERRKEAAPALIQEASDKLDELRIQFAEELAADLDEIAGNVLADGKTLAGFGFTSALGPATGPVQIGLDDANSPDAFIGAQLPGAVTPVPLPAGGVLMLLGLASLGACRVAGRRKRAGADAA